MAENLDGLHKDYNYKLCKTALGKDEVAGSDPAIRSIEILRMLAGFLFMVFQCHGRRGVSCGGPGALDVLCKPFEMVPGNKQIVRFLRKTRTAD